MKANCLQKLHRHHRNRELRMQFTRLSVSSNITLSFLWVGFLKYLLIHAFAHIKYFSFTSQIDKKLVERGYGYGKFT